MTTGRCWVELTARLVRTTTRGLHRASTLAATTALAIGLTAGVAHAQPANDTCATAATASLGANAGNNTGATTTVSTSCGLGGNSDIWWVFTAPSDGFYQFDTNGSALNDTVMSLWADCAGTEIECDDDDGDGLKSLITTCLTGGTTVWISVADWASSVSQGPITLNVNALMEDTGACCLPEGCVDGLSLCECEALGGDYLGDGSTCATEPTGACCLPGGACIITSACECAAIGGGYRGDGSDCSTACAPNDLCRDAIRVGADSTTAGSTTNATFDGVGSCGTSNTAPGVWYSVLGTGNTMTASTCNQATFDTKISIFCGGCDDLECVAGLDDAAGCSGFTTELSWCSIEGAEYLILVHGFGGSTGDFDLTVSDSGSACTPDVVCPLAPGACCLEDGSCVDDLLPEDCSSQGGVYQGPETTCAASDCIGRCCFGNPAEPSCDDISEAACASLGGFSWDADRDCTAGCLPVGRCCYGDPTSPDCDVLDSAECAALGGLFEVGGSCLDDCPIADPKLVLASGTADEKCGNTKFPGDLVVVTLSMQDLGIY
ncbi:MAG: hypothetical protein ACYTG3_21570, partial [Planctomycetota bacterium]